MTNQQASGGLATLTHFHYRPGSVLFLQEYVLILITGLTFWHVMLLLKLPSMDVHSVFIHHYGILYNIPSFLSKNPLHRQISVAVAVGSSSCNSLIMLCPPLFWSIWLDIIPELSFKDTVSAPWWQLPRGLWHIFQKAVHSLNLGLIHGTAFPIARGFITFLMKV